MSFVIPNNGAVSNVQEEIGESSSATTAERSTPAQCETTKPGRNTARRPKELPLKLAKLEGAQKLFLVNGEKWVQSTKANVQSANEDDATRNTPLNHFRPILAAPDVEMQVDPPLEQPAKTNSHEPSIESRSSAGANPFRTVATPIMDMLDSDRLLLSPFSIGYWAHIDSYLPPRSSPDSVPRALSGAAYGTYSGGLLALPNVTLQERDTIQAPDFAAAINALMADPGFLSQMPGRGMPVGQREMGGPYHQSSWDLSSSPVNAFELQPRNQMNMATSNDRQAFIHTPQPQLYPIPEALESAASHLPTDKGGNI